MIKRLICAGCAAALLLLSGCRLAQPEVEARGVEQDQLVGVLVSKDPLAVPDGAERVWAAPVTNTLTGDGGTLEHQTYRFPDLEGWTIYAAQVTDPETGERYTACEGDEIFTDTSFHVSATDSGERMEMSATIYVVSFRSLTLYLNPIYQTADGTVYVTRGNGTDVQGMESGSWSQSLESTRTVNGQETAGSVLLEVAVMCAPSGITVVQLSGDYAVLDTAVWEPGMTPEALTPLPDTACLLVETTGEDGQIRRELLDRGASELRTFTARADGICVARTTAIHWTE